MGGVIALTKPLFAPRAYLGFCLFVGLLGSIEIDRKKILQSVNTLFVFVFVYSLISFSNSYGNALKSQDSYRKFRLGLVTQDLSKVVSLPIKNKIKLHLSNEIGYAKPVLNASYHYPLMKRLIPKQGGKWEWRFGYIRYMWLNLVRCRKTGCLDENNSETLVNTTFHSIKKVKNSDCYIVEFK